MTKWVGKFFSDAPDTTTWYDTSVSCPEPTMVPKNKLTVGCVSVRSVPVLVFWHGQDILPVESGYSQDSLIEHKNSEILLMT